MEENVSTVRAERRLAPQRLDERSSRRTTPGFDLVEPFGDGHAAAQLRHAGPGRRYDLPPG